MTGMTRFATFWVEKGQIAAPIDVLRFDDTIYRILGSNLEALTKETELILESGTTASARSRRSRLLPAASVVGARVHAVRRRRFIARRVGMRMCATAL
jgi:predicted Zn-dependent protease